MERKRDKPVVWLHGEIKTPPFTPEARIKAGLFLRKLQRGESVPMPHSRPMPVVGRACHELRVFDKDRNWRIVYHLSAEAVVILEVFSKTTNTAPERVIQRCQRRLRMYLNLR